MRAPGCDKAFASEASERPASMLAAAELRRHLTKWTHQPELWTKCAKYVPISVNLIAIGQVRAASARRRRDGRSPWSGWPVDRPDPCGFSATTAIVAELCRAVPRRARIHCLGMLRGGDCAPLLREAETETPADPRAVRRRTASRRAQPSPRCLPRRQPARRRVFGRQAVAPASRAAQWPLQPGRAPTMERRRARRRPASIGRQISAAAGRK
jgi:hypothetical protein